LVASRGVDAEVSVVHNGGAVPDLPTSVRVIDPGRNLGFAGGANVAVKALLRGDAEFVLVTSHDLIVEPSTIAGLVDAARRHDRCGIVGPRYRDPKHDRCRVDLGEGDVLVDAWIGACLLLRRACVEEVGPFDVAFGSYLEDVDYCYRARELGWDVVVAPVHADTLGTQSSRVGAIATANWAVFDLKRAKSPFAVVRVLGRVLKGYAWALGGSMAFWRSSPQRRRSSSYRKEWQRVLGTLGRRTPHAS
jgi:cellulose synthase/poly-beta-1,6-N-acetylglucosamine synthase-like glycosyltransferase